MAHHDQEFHENKWSVHDNIWNFSVTDPQLHRKGYTIYKVTCQTFPIKFPETLTEFVCWKRYNDFKTLHKALLALHKALHRKDQFPEFAKPKLFGRFDNSVIEERRLSAIELLNFVATQPHLYKSLVFKQFLQDGKGRSDPGKKGSIMTPLSSNIISSGHKSDDTSQCDLLPVVTTHEDKMLAGHVVEVENQAVLMEINTSPNNYSRAAMLEGTWNFPQVADTISLDSSTGDETLDTDEDSILTNSLPDTDLTYFDPVSQESTSTSPDDEDPKNKSNSWLLASLNLCSQFTHLDTPNEEETLKVDGIMDRSETMASTDSTLTNTSLLSSSTLEKQSDNSSRKGSLTSGNKSDLEQFDPIRRDSKSSDVSKVECGKGDLDLSSEWQNRSCSIVSVGSQKSYNEDMKQLDEIDKNCSRKSSRSHSVSSEKSLHSDRGSSNKSTPSHTSKSLLNRLVGGSPKKLRSMTDQSVTTMDLGGKEDYIYLAASQISMAQNSEANGEFDVAFAYYKSGVGILLQGVQGDTNRARRDAVRRKTAQYLMKAEDLFSKHLTTENMDERRWGADSFLSPSLDLDPSFAFIRGSVRELHNFQVLGTIDKVILVRDKSTDETFIFKSIPKASSEGPRTQSILPTSCPHMVSLHKFYETDDSIFLLLQYASGGKLWSYIGDYLNCDKGNVELGLIKPGVTNIYSGTKVETTTDKSAEQEHLDQLPNELTSPDDLNVMRFSTLNNQSSELNTGIEDSDNFSYKEKVLESSISGSGTDSQKKHLAFNRRFSSLSDDCVQITELDSSVISPSTLVEEDHFQTFLQGYRTNVEGFSINSFDSEDTQRHSMSFRDKIDSIPEDSPASPINMSMPRQISADEVFHFSTQEGEVCCESKTRHLSNDDIAALTLSGGNENSNEPLQEFDRVPLQSADSMNKAPTLNCDCCVNEDIEADTPPLGAVLVVQQDDTSLSNEELSIYDVNRSSEDDTSDHNSNTNTGPIVEAHLAPDTIVEGHLALDTIEVVLMDSDYSSSCGELKDNPGTETLENNINCHPEIKSISKAPSLFSRQTSTPSKLILNRMNSKDITRSASFECDLKSPTRNRTRTVTDMFERLDHSNSEAVHIPETSIKKWMAQLVTAVSRLHSLGIICRDLKPNNVLLGEGGQIFLTYFCQVGQGECDLDWEAVQNLYAAPEVRSISGYDKTCDWWSIGALLYELLVGRSLADCHPGGINSHTCLFVPSFVSDEAKGLLEGLLKHNPHERLGAGIAGSEELKAHPFFTGVDWHALEYS